jgi:hypothetical protein
MPPSPARSCPTTDRRTTSPLTLAYLFQLIERATISRRRHAFQAPSLAAPGFPRQVPCPCLVYVGAAPQLRLSEKQKCPTLRRLRRGCTNRCLVILWWVCRHGGLVCVCACVIVRAGGPELPPLPGLWARQTKCDWRTRHACAETPHPPAEPPAGPRGSRNTKWLIAVSCGRFSARRRCRACVYRLEAASGKGKGSELVQAHPAVSRWTSGPGRRSGRTPALPYPPPARI